MKYDRNRIEFLREKALYPQISYDEFYYYFHKRMLQNEGETYLLRYADALNVAFSSASVVIDDQELIVGKLTWNGLSEEQKAEWKEMKTFVFAHAGTMFGQDSHMAIDYDLLLSQGVLGIIAKIDAYRDDLDLTNVGDIEKDEFYSSCKKCLEGVIFFSERYAEEAKRLAECCDNSVRIAELQEIAANCSRVPAHPAVTFYEAVQSVHFLTLCLSNKPLRYSDLQYQIGHPDRFLLSYFEKDLREGRLTREKAQTVLDCLGIITNHRVRSGISSGYMVGGREKDGNVVSNELTRMLLSVIDHVRLVYPAVGLCCCEDTPEEDFALASQLLQKGYSHPAIFNDDIITKGLLSYGVSEEEAHSYIHSNCVEITPVGASNAWVASQYTNLVQVLLDVMNKEYTSTEEVIQAFLAQLAKSIRGNFISQNQQRIERRFTSVDPLLSCFVHDCLENGVDIEHGGAKYNWIMPSFVGISNLVDSLMTIDSLLINQKRFTFKEFKSILEQNFEGYENERRYIQNRIEKYGNDSDKADSYVKRITEWIAVECEKYTTIFQNGRLIPSLFCWVMHEWFGQETGASPDGRLAGFPLGDGSGPAQGREKNGPTASILSCTKWDHTKFIGGIAVNLKFTTNLFREKEDKLTSLIKTFLTRGGFELQINVINNETLLEAQKHPENFSDLVVRIGGYSDYFVRLTPAMQAEVIQRTEHCL